MEQYEEYTYPKSFSLKVWKKLLPFVKSVRRQLIIAVISMVVCAGADASYPLIIRHLINNNLLPGTRDGAAQTLMVFGGLILLSLVFEYCFLRFGMFAEHSLTRNLRGAVFKHLQVLPISYYNQTPVGYIMARTMSDSSNIGDNLIWCMVDVTWAVAYIAFALTSMFILNWKLALILAAFMLVLGFLTFKFQKYILTKNRELRRKNSVMTGAMNEGIVGAKTTKTLVLEDMNLGEFKGVTGEMRKMATRLGFMRGIYGPLIFTCCSFAVAVILVAGGWLSMEQGLLLGTFTAFVNYAAEIVNPLNNIASTLPEFVSTQANVERVTALLERQPEIVERPEVVERYGDNFNPRRENWEPLLGDVDFEDVTFMYPDGNVNVLEHFNLKVPRGGTVAIVGETGAGKSTLVNLVCRFFEPTEGRVLIDGRDIRERTQLWLHSNLGYVLQNPHLFSGSIIENIRYGRLDASDDDVKAAARAVSAHLFIEKLENSWATDAGEGGDKLSTGQKQLVSLARAVLADPRIFILDEATSSIDTETELLIRQATAKLLDGRTSFVIAHRLSTIRSADLILVVHDGKITERGSHDELMAMKGNYYELYTRDFAGDED